VNIKEFAAELESAGAGHNPGRIRHRLKARPCPHARRVLDETGGRVFWEFEPAAVQWWLADMESAKLEQREKSAAHCRALAVRRRK